MDRVEHFEPAHSERPPISSEDLGQFEEEVGRQLPDSYKNLVSTIGPGPYVNEDGTEHDYAYLFEAEDEREDDVEFNETLHDLDDLKSTWQMIADNERVIYLPFHTDITGNYTSFCYAESSDPTIVKVDHDYGIVPVAGSFDELIGDFEVKHYEMTVQQMRRVEPAEDAAMPQLQIEEPQQQKLVANTVEDVVSVCSLFGQQHKREQVRNAYGAATSLFSLTDERDLVDTHEKLMECLSDVWEEDVAYRFCILMTEKTVLAQLAAGSVSQAYDSYYELERFWLDHKVEDDWFLMPVCRMLSALVKGYLDIRETTGACERLAALSYWFDRYPERLLEAPYRETIAEAATPIVALELRRKPALRREWQLVNRFLKAYGEAAGNPDLFATQSQAGNAG